MVAWQSPDPVHSREALVWISLLPDPDVPSEENALPRRRRVGKVEAEGDLVTGPRTWGQERSEKSSFQYLHLVSAALLLGQAARGRPCSSDRRSGVLSDCLALAIVHVAKMRDERSTSCLF